MLDGKRFRFVGFNYYHAVIESTSQASLQTLFTKARRKGVTVVRTWCFDAGDPPSDSAGNFRFLDYSLGTNLITNNSFESNTTGWTLGTGYSRVSEDAHAGSYAIKSVQSSGYEQLISDSITVTENTDYVYTFWRKVSVTSGLAPVTFIKGVQTNTTIKDAGYSSATSGAWVRKQVLFNSGANTQVQVRHVNWNGAGTAYYDDFNLCVQTTPQLAWREATFQQLDMVLDEARKQGVRLILSLSDNPTYDTKKTYVGWANTIEGAGLSTSFPYTGFFTSTYCKAYYKQFVDTLTSRVNTVNGRTYKDDDTIFAWELGNELRLDRDDPSGINSEASANLALLSGEDGWIDEMSTYVKSVDTNHLVAFGDCAHTWQWVSGDTVSNGSYYGVDYDKISQLPNVDYLDFHIYPTQGGDGTQLQKFGQRLGYPNAITGEGYRRQIQDYIKVGKANGKPVVCGEIGWVKEVVASNTYTPMYPRHNAFKRFFQYFFGAGGDGVLIWSASTNPTAGSYSVVLDGVAEEIANENTDDRPLMSLVAQWNSLGRGERRRVDDVVLDI